MLVGATGAGGSEAEPAGVAFAMGGAQASMVARSNQRALARAGRRVAGRDWTRAHDR